MEAAVIAYLAQLSPEELDVIVARARAAAQPIEPTPPSIAPPMIAPSVIVAAPIAPVEDKTDETPAAEPEPAIAFRPTLKSVDLEVVDEPKPSARPTPPPLPPRATTPPPAPIVVPVAAAAPVLELVMQSAIETPMPTPAAAPIATATATAPVSGTSPIAPIATVIVAPPADLPPPPARALSVPDLTDLLFEAMTDLPFCDTAVEGGAYCLTSLLRALPSLAGIVSLFDPEARELVVVYAQGPRAERLLLTRFAGGDPLVASAVEKNAPVVETYGPDAAGRTPRERHAAFGEPWSVLVAPVMRGGRLLGTIELVDPIDGSPFDDRASDALRYVAAQWAELIAERGIRLPRLVAPPVEDARA